MAALKKTIMCSTCVKRDCRDDYPEGIPAYCVASQYKDIVAEKSKSYASPDVLDIYKAASKVVGKGYRKWPRVQEAIEFAKELKLKKIGLASCMALINEMHSIGELFTGAGFEVISAACQIGRVSPSERGVTMEETHGAYCNPIVQAEILNKEKTELNFLLGLCLGHDILFNRYSKAPVSTLIVKDRVTGNNPSAALYSSFHRRSLWKTYCNKDVD